MKVSSYLRQVYLLAVLFFIANGTMASTSSIGVAADLDALQRAAEQTTQAQKQLIQTRNEHSSADLIIQQLTGKLQQAKAAELALYQKLVQRHWQQAYNKVLKAKTVVVEGIAECQRIDSQQECLNKAEQAALALAAKEGGHYYIEADSSQEDTRQSNAGKISTSSAFREQVNIKVKAHVLGFSRSKQKINKSPYSNQRQAVVEITAEVAGQENNQLKHSLQLQAKQRYQPYLSSQELSDISQYQVLSLANWQIEMVQVPAGTFKLGSLTGDRNEMPATAVQVNSFYLARSEVTKSQYNKCIKALVCSAPLFTDNLSEPAVELSWREIVDEFIPWLSNVTGYQFYLPSEMQWEYVAKTGQINAPLCHIANGRLKFSQCDDGYDKLAPVAMLKANKYGIYDLQGNAAEWTSSCWRFDHKSNTHKVCSKAVIKGGSWYNKAHYLRPSARFGKSKQSKLDTLGFRLALSI